VAATRNAATPQRRNGEPGDCGHGPSRRPGQLRLSLLTGGRLWLAARIRRASIAGGPVGRLEQLPGRVARVGELLMQAQYAGLVAALHLLGSDQRVPDRGAEDDGVVEVPVLVLRVLPVVGAFQDQGARGVGNTDDNRAVVVGTHSAVDGALQRLGAACDLKRLAPLRRWAAWRVALLSALILRICLRDTFNRRASTHGCAQDRSGGRVSGRTPGRLSFRTLTILQVWVGGYVAHRHPFTSHSCSAKASIPAN
jgi:hypothetical protein